MRKDRNMINPYSENQLIEQTAISLLEDMDGNTTTVPMNSDTVTIVR